MPGRPDLKLDWCSHAAAKYAVEHWHYSRCMVPSKSVKLGVWEQRGFVGAVVFGVGATPNICRAYGVPAEHVCELVRIALTTHQHPVSRIVAIALRKLCTHCPHLRLVVSYADPGYHHHGGIYQAMNWIYTGKTPTDREVWLHGKWVHRRVITHTMSSSRLLHRTRQTPGKHRYLYPLDAAMRAQIAPLAHPYPKRATSILADAPTDQAGESGAAPTVALAGREA